MPRIPMIMVPVAGTCGDNATRRVDPNIIGNPGKTIDAFVKGTVASAVAEAGVFGQTFVHCPWGNNKLILDGKYCADSWFHCRSGFMLPDGTQIPPYPALIDGFEAAYEGSKVGFYAPSPVYNPSHRALLNCYAPMTRTRPPFIIVDHATEHHDRQKLMKAIFGPTPMLVEGGSPDLIDKWGPNVGWFLESRNPDLWSERVKEIAKTRRVVAYIGGWQSMEDRVVLAKRAVEYGYDPCLTFNDVPKYRAAGVTVESLARAV